MWEDFLCAVIEFYFDLVDYWLLCHVCESRKSELRGTMALGRKHFIEKFIYNKVVSSESALLKGLILEFFDEMFVRCNVFKN